MIRHRTRPTRHEPTHPAGYQETPARTVLRADKSGPGLVCSISHGTSRSVLEASHADAPFFSGEWRGERLMEPASAAKATGVSPAWTTLCSEVNDLSEYVELHRPLPDGGAIERQVFLARRDQFLFLADVVLAPGRLTGEYQMSIPLAEGVEYRGERDTQDGRLARGRRRIATVLPLSLPEWRRQPGGSLSATATELTLHLPLEGQRAHAALFIDLDPRRQGKPVTWRRLTVAESLHAVPSDIAVGYRVQIGTSQWLFYRSLAPRGNRTVLGQNFSTEFVAARFPTSGVAEKMLEIE